MCSGSGKMTILILTHKATPLTYIYIYKDFIVLTSFHIIYIFTLSGLPVSLVARVVVWVLDQLASVPCHRVEIMHVKIASNHWMHSKLIMVVEVITYPIWHLRCLAKLKWTRCQNTNVRTLPKVLGYTTIDTSKSFRNKKSPAYEVSIIIIKEPWFESI